MRDRPYQIAGRDYPRTYQELLEWFADEQACRQYLVRCHWPDGFECAQCGGKSETWGTGRGYLHCRRCGGEISITAGTSFDRSRMPLRTWFAAMWFVTSQRDGASALGLKRVRGLGSYQTAWTWLPKLRQAMVCPGRYQFHDRIDVDETIWAANEGVAARGGRLWVSQLKFIRRKGSGEFAYAGFLMCLALALWCSFVTLLKKALRFDRWMRRRHEWLK